MQARAADATLKMASVRFGNVLGSRGSLLSVLAEQIEQRRAHHDDPPRRDPVLHDHRRGGRAGARGGGDGEFGETFVLDMGEPVRIVDLVKNYAAELHLDSRQVDICYTGLRPGEKLNEALYSEAEEQVSTAHPRVFAALPRMAAAPVVNGLYEALVAASDCNDAPEVKRLLGALLPDYEQPTPQETPTFAMAAPYPDDY